MFNVNKLHMLIKMVYSDSKKCATEKDYGKKGIQIYIDVNQQCATVQGNVEILHWIRIHCHLKVFEPKGVK